MEKDGIKLIFLSRDFTVAAELKRKSDNCPSRFQITDNVDNIFSNLFY